jgi:hypothetical protein
MRTQHPTAAPTQRKHNGNRQCWQQGLRCSMKHTCADSMKQTGVVQILLNYSRFSLLLLLLLLPCAAAAGAAA